LDEISKMKLIAIALPLLLLSSPAFSIPPDNLRFYAGIADSATTLFLSSLTINDDDGFIIKSQQTHNADFILEQSLINYIKAKGAHAFLESNSEINQKPNAGYTVEYKILMADLRYEKARGKSPPGKKLWRNGNLAGIFRLISNDDGEVIKTEELNIADGDFISRKEAMHFNGLGNFYIKPEISEGFLRYVEPVLVGATVATLIVLFFSNR